MGILHPTLSLPIGGGLGRVKFLHDWSLSAHVAARGLRCSARCAPSWVRAEPPLPCMFGSSATPLLVSCCSEATCVTNGWRCRRRAGPCVRLGPPRALPSVSRPTLPRVLLAGLQLLPRVGHLAGTHMCGPLGGRAWASGADCLLMTCPLSGSEIRSLLEPIRAYMVRL